MKYKYKPLALKIAEPEPVPPAPPVAAELGSTFAWTHGADVQKVWRKYGWRPPSEYRDDYLFKVNRELTRSESQ